MSERRTQTGFTEEPVFWKKNSKILSDLFTSLGGLGDELDGESDEQDQDEYDHETRGKHPHHVRLVMHLWNIGKGIRITTQKCLIVI